MAENKKEKQSEDLFEETKMSFGSHIEELRVVLVRSLIGVGVGMAIGLWVGPRVVEFLQEPLIVAIKDFQKNRATAEYLAEHEYIPPYVRNAVEKEFLVPTELHIEASHLASAIRASTTGETVRDEDLQVGFVVAQLKLEKTGDLCKKIVESEDKEIQVIRDLLDSERVDQLRLVASKESPAKEDRKLVIDALNSILENQDLKDSEVFREMIESDEGLVIQRDYVDQRIEAGELKPNAIRSLNQYLVGAPFVDELEDPTLSMIKLEVWEPIVQRAQSLGIQEPFMVWLKAGFFTGLAIASPWVFMQIWSFVAGGLYPHEKKYVYFYMPFSLVLFVTGAAFAFYVVFKFVLDFLFTFNAQMGIEPDPRIGEYLGFVMMLPLGFGFAFQLPLVMLFVHRIGLVSIQMYLSKWRIAVLVICVISMIFTPTDPISMIMMAFPLIGLYFFGILLCKWMPRGRNPFSEAYDPA